MVFNSLEETDLEKLSSDFEKWDLQTGDVIAQAGNLAEYYFLLEKGTLILAMDGGKAIVLDSPGDFMALELLGVKNLYKATLTALEDGSVFAVSKEAFLGFIQEDTEAAATIMEAWQIFCDEKAGFIHNTQDIQIPEIL